MRNCVWKRRSVAGWPLAAAFAVLCGFGIGAPAYGDDEAPEGMVQLELDLPSPSYSGSPFDFSSPRLEPMTWARRENPYVPEGTVNLALNRPLTASAEPRYNALEDIVNGEKAYDTESVVELPSGPQWIQIDLEQEASIYAVVLWHFFESERVYFDVVVAVSNDPEFEEDVHVLYNNDYENRHGLGEGEDYQYVETHEGRLIDAEGVQARYVRFYSNGNNWDARNHYIEAEVYGLPAA